MKRIMFIRTAVACSFAAACALPAVAAEDLAPTCANALTNLGFETSDFTGWTVVDHPAPFVPVTNQPAGFSPGFGLFATAPNEGLRVMSHGFDGGSPPPGDTIRVFQELVVPKNNLNLEFDYRAGWDMVSFPGSTLPREFYVDIEPSGGGTALQTTPILTAPPATQTLDTGNQRGSVPLTSFAGQTVRVSFEWFIPEAFTGPAHFQLDNVMPLLPSGMTLDGNGVFEPGETANVRPGWLNCSTLAVATTGAATTFTGPGASSYTIVDSTADYVSIPAGSSGDCLAGGGNCYVLSISVPPARPAQHWDAALTEQLSSPGLKDWAIHVGASFADVPASNPFYRFIETLLHAGVTGGCSATDYCPANPTARDQMAVFVLVAKEGAGYAPPACVAGSEAFADVPASSPFCRWIEELALRGVVSGCGGGNYCPQGPVTREQMGVFISATFGLTLYGP